MNVFRSIVFSAVVAGLAVGGAITVIQQYGTVPLILKAEVYEKAAEHREAGFPAAPSALPLLLATTIPRRRTANARATQRGA